MISSRSGFLRIPGKCILTGEHAVVRGAPAIVLPLASRHLELSWEYQPEAMDEVIVESAEIEGPFLESLNKGLNMAELSLPRGKWKFQLSSTIPVRAGLGSSAALVVGVLQLLERLGVKVKDRFQFALELENLFHGTSSGIDVAAVLEGKPIHFERGKAAIPLQLPWKPKLYLLDSGTRSSTKACVEKVVKFNRVDLDLRMKEASLLAKHAFELSEKEGVASLAKALQLARTCFEEWSLIPEEVGAAIQLLERRGAIAVKPTGSGDGGFVLSLWSHTPPKELSLIPVLADS